MKITIEPTLEIVQLTIDGTPVPTRIWSGTTDKGTKVDAYVLSIVPAEEGGDISGEVPPFMKPSRDIFDFGGLDPVEVHRRAVDGALAGLVPEPTTPAQPRKYADVVSRQEQLASAPAPLWPAHCDRWKNKPGPIHADCAYVCMEADGISVLTDAERTDLRSLEQGTGSINLAIRAAATITRLARDLAEARDLANEGGTIVIRQRDALNAAERMLKAAISSLKLTDRWPGLVSGELVKFDNERRSKNGSVSP